MHSVNEQTTEQPNYIWEADPFQVQSDIFQPDRKLDDCNTYDRVDSKLYSSLVC